MLASIVYGDRVAVLKSMFAAYQTPKEMKLLGKEDAWSSRSCRRILPYAKISLLMMKKREGAKALSCDSLFPRTAACGYRSWEWSCSSSMEQGAGVTSLGKSNICQGGFFLLS